MGFLDNGVWNTGQKLNLSSLFVNWVTKDGSAGPTGDAGFKAESDRYHLYIGHGCPFANRVTIMMHLKQLSEHISVTACAPQMYQEKGWGFVSEDGYSDPLYGKNHLHEIYAHLAPGMTGSCSVPLLVDKINNKIVSTDSASIMQMLNSAFDDITGNKKDFYGQPGLEAHADLVQSVCIGIYRVGLNPDAQGYVQAFNAFFTTLDKLEQIFSKHKFINGECLSEVDIKLFATLIRFDAAYYSLYHCNKHRVMDYRNIFRWIKQVYQYEGIGENTINFEHIKKLYYGNKTQNPSQRVPLGPFIDYNTPV